MDPRSGSTLRKLVVAALSPRLLEDTRTLLEATADRLLNDVAAGERLDVVADFAEPFTLTAAARLLGVPDHEHGRFQKVAASVSGLLFGAMTGSARLDEAQAERLAAFAEFIAAMFEYRMANPGRDLITAILRAHEAGDPFDEGDYLPFLACFLFASHENMANFIANAMRVLAQAPDQQQLLHASPGLLAASGLDELLRYDSPVQFLMIRLLDDVEVGGTPIAAGDAIMVGVGSANRDPSQFVDPDRLDLRRSAGRHLGFGSGPLTCVGAALARLEGQVAIAKLLQRFPAPIVEDSVAWRRMPPVLRGIESLVIGEGTRP